MAINRLRADHSCFYICRMFLRLLFFPDGSTRYAWTIVSRLSAINNALSFHKFNAKPVHNFSCDNSPFKHKPTLLIIDFSFYIFLRKFWYRNQIFLQRWSIKNVRWYNRNFVILTVYAFNRVVSNATNAYSFPSCGQNFWTNARVQRWKNISIIRNMRSCAWVVYQPRVHVSRTIPNHKRECWRLFLVELALFQIQQCLLGLLLDSVGSYWAHNQFGNWQSLDQV